MRKIFAIGLIALLVFPVNSVDLGSLLAKLLSSPKADQLFEEVRMEKSKITLIAKSPEAITFIYKEIDGDLRAILRKEGNKWRIEILPLEKPAVLKKESKTKAQPKSPALPRGMTKVSVDPARKKSSTITLAPPADSKKPAPAPTKRKPTVMLASYNPSPALLSKGKPSGPKKSKSPAKPAAAAPPKAIQHKPKATPPKPKPTSPAPVVEISGQKKPTSKKSPLDELLGEKAKKRITLRLREASVVDFLSWLQRETGVNIVSFGDLSSIPPLTLFLKEITLKEAFLTVCNVAGLGWLVKGKNLFVGPLDALRQIKENEAKASKLALVGREKTEIIHLSYLKPREARAYVEPFLDSGETVREVKEGLLIKASEEKIKKIKALLKEIDAPPQQIRINVKLIDVSREALDQLGFAWGVHGVASPERNSQVNAVFPYKGEVKGIRISTPNTPTIPNEAINTVTSSGNILDTSLRLGSIYDIFEFSMRLAALQQEGKAKVILSSFVVASNGEKASLVSGDRVPIQTFQEFAYSARYEQAALQLLVTPYIIGKDLVRMDLEIKDEAPDFSRTVNGMPTIKTRTVRTSAFIREGEYLVVGGLTKTKTDFTQKRIPFLGTLPIIGSLFRGHRKEDSDKELVIILSQKILSGRKT